MTSVNTIAPWSWRKASGGCIPGNRRIFHAYDVNDNAACNDAYGLVASCEEPNEGSELCSDCVEVCKAKPAGREPRHAARPAASNDPT